MLITHCGLKKFGFKNYSKVSLFFLLGLEFFHYLEIVFLEDLINY